MLHRVLAALVDVLPLRLWHPTNLYLRGHLHFCVGSLNHEGVTDAVRTVEWDGREFAHGHRPFPHEEWERRWPEDDLHHDGGVEVACAFCGGHVEPTDEDPVGVGVIEQWRPYDEDIDWIVYAHRACLISRFDEATREALSTPDNEGP